MQSQPGEFVLETERLLLCIPPAAVAPRVVEYLQRNQEHFASSSPAPPTGFYTEAFWRGRLEVAREEFSQGRSVRLLLFRRDDPAGPVLGDLTFSNIVRGPFQACYLGYQLDHAHVGQGLMFEALRTAIDYMFRDLKLHRIMANYMPTNVRSGRLLRRLGFVPEGYARDYLFLAGAWQDHILTALTNQAVSTL